MNRQVGLWINHREAVIVTHFDQKEEIRLIRSNVGKHIRYSGVSEASPGIGSHNDSAEDKRDQRFGEHLGKFYDEVISTLDDANSILILGPGEAKVEFQKRLEDQGISGRVVAVKTTDKLTDNEIAVEVRQYFQQISKET